MTTVHNIQSRTQRPRLRQCPMCRDRLFAASVGVLTDAGVRFGWTCDRCGYAFETHNEGIDAVRDD